MDRDLYRIDLDDLKFSDIELFTGISRPEAERPQESLRLDYNEHVPDDIGDIVTAFAALNYAHGWLDAGARIGLFDVGHDSELFTVD